MNPRPLTLWDHASGGLGFTTETVFNLYGQLLRPQERITKDASLVKGLKGGTGFEALVYNGKPILMDEKCISNAFSGKSPVLHIDEL